MAGEDWQLLIREAALSEGYDDDRTYVRAQFAMDGVSATSDVGIRLRGHFSLTNARGHSFPLKVDFNRFDADQTFDGLAKLNLNSELGPLSQIREHVSYQAWRDFGVPAPRTSFARVSLNGEELGLYVTVEQIDGRFLARNFPEPRGDLYKPEQKSGSLEYRGDDIQRYPDIGHKWPDDTDHAAFLAAVRAIGSEDLTRVSESFDIRSVLVYLAGNVVLGNWDNYRNTGHNYYLYEAEPGRFVMLPWDMNGSLEGWSGVCDADLWEGYREEPPLAPLLLSDAGFESEYLDLLRQFLEGPGSYESLARRIHAATRLLGGAVSPEESAAVLQMTRERTDALTEFLAAEVSCRK